MPSLERLQGVPADIELLAGPLLLGYCFNWCLFGVLCMQMYMYFLGFPNDLTGVQVLVYGLFFIDTLQTAMTTHNAWHFLVSGWGDPEALIKPGWSWIAVPLLSGIVSTTVQCFFAWRIYKISGKKWISIPIVLIAFLQGICAAISGIWFELINDVTRISFLFPTATIWLGGSALTDVIIAMTMIYLLRKSNTGFQGTDLIIRRLIRMTVETGSLTAFCACLELILYLKYKENNLHMIPALILSKLYSNTLVASLNSRNPQYRSSQRSDQETTGAGLHFKSSVGMVGPSTTQSKSTGGQVHFDDDRHSHGTKVQITTHQETHDSIPMSDLDDKHAIYSVNDDESDHKVNSDSLTHAVQRGQVVEDVESRRFYGRNNTDDLESARKGQY